MANICDNMFFLRTENENNFSQLTEEIQNLFDIYNFSTNEEKKSCNIDFESKWAFPKEEFQKLTDKIGYDDSLYIRVLSYEFGCEYVGYNIYKNNEWIK